MFIVIRYELIFHIVIADGFFCHTHTLMERVVAFSLSNDVSSPTGEGWGGGERMTH